MCEFPTVPTLPFVFFYNEGVLPGDAEITALVMPTPFAVETRLEFFDTESRTDPPEGTVYDRYGRALQLKIDISRGVSLASLKHLHPDKETRERVKRVLRRHKGGWQETAWKDHTETNEARTRRSCLVLAVSLFLLMSILAVYACQQAYNL